MSKLIENIDEQFRTEINGGTIMTLEVLASTSNKSVPSCRFDPIACVFIMIHNESAQIELGNRYNKVNILLINRRESMNINKAPLGIRNCVH